MGDILVPLANALAQPIQVNIYSEPAFAFELFLAAATLMTYILLLEQVHILYRIVCRKIKKEVAEAEKRAGIQAQKNPGNSLHNPRKLDSSSSLTICHVKQSNCKQRETLQTIFSSTSKLVVTSSESSTNIGLSASEGLLSIKRYDIHTRVRYLLNITPSQYVRNFKHRRNAKAGLKNCIESLTMILGNVKRDKMIDNNPFSKEVMRKSFEVIKDSMELLKDKNRFSSKAIQSSNPSLSDSETNSENILFRGMSTLDDEEHLNEDDLREMRNVSITVLQQSSCDTLEDILKEINNEGGGSVVVLQESVTC